MDIVNLVCYGYTVLVCGIALVLSAIFFVTSLYSCFTKKIGGKLLIKVLITFTAGFLIPWILKIMLIFLSKMGV